MKTEPDQIGTDSTDYKIYPRSKVEKLLVDFIVEHKIYAIYGKDSEGLFEVKFLVEEENV
jgi:hypothetical protein